MPKPKILEIISEMRASGMSDEEIIENLRQLGLTDDQIKEIMKVAEKDIYSKFKREMAVFVEQQIKKNRDTINSMVDEAISGKLEKIRDELSQNTQNEVGKLAEVVNKKTDEVSALGKKIREENLKLGNDVKAMRADVDLLLAGPTKLRLILGTMLVLIGVLVILFSMIKVAPSVLALNFADPMSGAILLGYGMGTMIAGSILVLAGLTFYGKPQ